MAFEGSKTFRGGISGVGMAFIHGLRQAYLAMVADFSSSLMLSLYPLRNQLHATNVWRVRTIWDGPKHRRLDGN